MPRNSSDINLKRMEMELQLQWAYSLYSPGNIPEIESSEGLRDIVFQFLVLFNIFEAQLFRRSDSNTNLDQISQDLGLANWFDINKYNNFGDFFVERYIKMVFGERTSLMI
jgi:hypothetical protein